ncbi:MAG: hypothetical protein WC315_06465 [Candidatus Omnitrophota bacterium]|jgi:hypothetical protein
MSENEIVPKSIESRDLAENNKSDVAAIAARSILGACPVVGSIMSELVTCVIPDQKIDRLIKFIAKLEERLNLVEKEEILRKVKNPECSDLIEESLHQAARALSDERTEYIASIVIDGLSASEISFNESKHLLRMLSEINDIEIIWLRFYAWPTLMGDEEFRDKHKEILEEKIAFIGAAQGDCDKAALQESYKEHLVRLGALEKIYKTDSKFKLPEFNTYSGAPEISRYEITLLGKLLLRKIGLIDESF